MLFTLFLSRFQGFNEPPFAVHEVPSWSQFSVTVRNQGTDARLIPSGYLNASVFTSPDDPVAFLREPTAADLLVLAFFLFADEFHW